MRHMIEVALRFSIRLTNLTKGVKMASLNDHRRILDHILAGDAESAEAAMRLLILEAQTLLNKARKIEKDRLKKSGQFML